MKSGNASSGLGTGRVLEKAITPSHKGTTTEQRRAANEPTEQMPTLFRFLMTIAVLAGLAYAGMFALATLVEPKKGEMTVRIPPEKLNPPQQ